MDKIAVKKIGRSYDNELVLIGDVLTEDGQSRPTQIVISFELFVKLLKNHVSYVKVEKTNAEKP